MACTSILKRMSDIPPWHLKGLVLTQVKELNSSLIFRYSFEMSFLFSSSLELVHLLTPCYYKAKKEICMGFFLRQEGRIIP